MRHLRSTKRRIKIISLGRNVATLNVDIFAKQEAQGFARDLGINRRQAYRKLKKIGHAILDSMTIGEEDEVPLPGFNGHPAKVILLKKVGENEFTARVK